MLALLGPVVLATSLLGAAAGASSPHARSSVASAPARTSLLVLDLAAESGVDPSTVRLLSRLITVELGAYPTLSVLSNADLQRLISLEAERSALGCSDVSCLSEIAGALGARLVTYGSVGRLGRKTVVELNLFDSHTAQSLGRQFIELEDESVFSSVLPARLRALLKQFHDDNALALPHRESSLLSSP